MAIDWTEPGAQRLEVVHAALERQPDAVFDDAVRLLVPRGELALIAAIDAAPDPTRLQRVRFRLAELVEPLRRRP